LLSSLMLSADSLIVAFAVSGFLSARNKFALVVLFGLCDACASFIGPSLGLALPAPGLTQSAFLIVWGGAIAFNLPIVAQTRRSPIWPYLLPPLFAIDNLVTPNTAPLSTGLVSSVMAALGFVLGSILLNRASERRVQARWVAGALVIAGITSTL
jgi:CDP-diglyceride synthetase